MGQRLPSRTNFIRYSPASLLVHERSNDIELDSEIENFWAGDKVYVSKVKGGLREIGQFKNYSFRAPKVRDLPPQRLSFYDRAYQGRRLQGLGWLLLDEIELVAQYFPPPAGPILR